VAQNRILRPGFAYQQEDRVQQIIRLSLFALLLAGSSAFAQTATNLTCTGCVGNSDLAANAVSNSKVVNNAINGAKIADGTVKASDLGSGAVTAAKIASNAVTGAKIQDGTVVQADLASSVRSLLNGAIADITTSAVSASAAGLATKLCPANTLAISASCECNSQGGSRNRGVLYACQVSNGGAIAACYPEAITYDEFLPNPLAIVTATCLGAVLNNGTPWVPPSEALVLGDAGEPTAPVDHEAALGAIQAEMADYEDALRRRRLEH
jgi:hypothetical protein